MARSEQASILVVEDDSVLLEMMGEFLASEGYDVATAQDGAGAIQAIEQHRHRAPLDLIILDIMLPRVDGHRVLTYLRMRRLSIPVVAVSARDDALPVAESLGARTTLAKPFDLRQLLQVIEQQLGRDVAVPELC